MPRLLLAHSRGHGPVFPPDTKQRDEKIAPQLQARSKCFFYLGTHCRSRPKAVVPSLWIGKGSPDTLCAVTAMSNRAGAALCAYDTRESRITRATPAASASSPPSSTLPLLSSALGEQYRHQREGILWNRVSFITFPLAFSLMSPASALPPFHLPR